MDEISEGWTTQPKVDDALKDNPKKNFIKFDKKIILKLINY